MNTKRIGKWVIVLFLLAALPGMTAVMAQGQEPATQAPEVMEKGETDFIVPWSNTESQPNNVRANAEPFRIMQGGTLSSNSDVDFFKVLSLNMDNLYIGETNSPILIDVEAASMGSPMKVLIKLWAPDGTLVDSAEYYAGRDPLLYYNLESLWPNSPVSYLSVQGAPGNGGYGPNYKYQVLFSNPLLISAAAAGLGTGSVDGISFNAGDILAWSQYDVNGTTYEKWHMLLDLSDVGLKGNITNLAGAWRYSDFLLVGFAADTTLPGGAGMVKPQDVAVFDPSRVGADTAGTFTKWWVGSDQGLTTAGEALDAIDWPDWDAYMLTQLYVSTTGAASVPTGGAPLKLADEDISEWNHKSGTSWKIVLDNSTVPGMAAEDVIAFSASRDTREGEDFVSWDWLYNFVIAGTARCGPAPQALITQKDIARHHHERFFDGTIEGGEWFYRQCQLMWHGPDHGWNYNIDAIEYYHEP